ncbi:putative protein polybromo-1-like [Penaeus vannamei]|uniref:Uncharacterized protein n=1 Tax=Penaeus vannamei TaxID=6689 RepID=A0A423SNA0_PENVA|nr:putative protein polybromo-1-like [Penaeus vannamei]
MPKRKRLSDGEEGESPVTTPVVEGRPKRRRNDTTLVDTIQYIFDALRNKKKDDDVYLCEAFLRVPRKKTEPQYYEMISGHRSQWHSANPGGFFRRQVNSASASAFTEVLATHSSATSPSKRNSSDSASERDAPHTYKRGAPEPSDLSLVGSASPGPGEVKVVKRSAQSQPLVRYLPQNLVTVLERACTSTSTSSVLPVPSIAIAGCLCSACSYVAGQDPLLKLTLEAKSTYLLSPGLMTWFHCNFTPSGLLHLSCSQSGFEDPTPYRYLLTCYGDRRLRYYGKGYLAASLCVGGARKSTVSGPAASALAVHSASSLRIAATPPPPHTHIRKECGHLLFSCQLPAGLCITLQIADRQKPFGRICSTGSGSWQMSGPPDLNDHGVPDPKPSYLVQDNSSIHKSRVAMAWFQLCRIYPNPQVSIPLG